MEEQLKQNNEKIIEKIKKLLALGTNNDNEEEAERALAKARELMMQYSIEEKELRGVGDRELRFIPVPEGTFTKRYTAWKVWLAVFITKYHRCSIFSSPDGWKRLDRTITFVGEGADPEIARAMYVAALLFIENRIKSIRKTQTIPSNVHDYMIGKSYTVGFIKGLRSVYEAQNSGEEKEKYELMMTTPKTVNDYMSKLGTYQSGNTSREDFSGFRGDCYMRGLADGKDYGSKPTEKLSGASGYLEG